METREFSGRTVDEALTTATVELGVTSDMVEYDVIEKGSSGILGFGSKDAVIRVRIKESTDDEIKEDTESADDSGNDSFEENIKNEVASSDTAVSDDSAPVQEAAPTHSSSRKKKDVSLEPVDWVVVEASCREFLGSVFNAMGIEVALDLEFDDETNSMSVDMSGPNMGLIIGKRGQTLDSLQYLTNLVVNKSSDSYVRVKLDTEDYRRRRKATLENLAKNVAFKVKRSKRSVSLEPMNPYERRVIHFALQNDSYVTTYSEGEEPYRHVVVDLK